MPGLINLKILFLFQTCVEIAEGGCTLGKVTNTTPAAVETTPAAIVTTAAPVETTTKSDVTTPAPLCPLGVFGNVPHPDRCDAFYMCAGGQAILLTCTDGHEFDPDLRVREVSFIVF